MHQTAQTIASPVNTFESVLNFFWIIYCFRLDRDFGPPWPGILRKLSSLLDDNYLDITLDSSFVFMITFIQQKFTK